MANLLQAVNAYGPKIVLNKTVDLPEVSNWISMRTSVNKSEVQAILQELSDCLLFFNNLGTPVKLSKIGTFTPSVNREGERKLNIRLDVALKRGINDDGDFNANIINKANIGLTNEQYKALWDADHPDDPLEI
jgi:hypothetical protein